MKFSKPTAAIRGAMIAACAVAGLSLKPVAAAELFDSAKLLATGGVSQVEGAGGGGLAPWALITGYGTRDAIGANVHYTYANLPDFTLHSGGVAVGFFDRVEVSYARQWFDTGEAGGVAAALINKRTLRSSPSRFNVRRNISNPMAAASIREPQPIIS